MGTPRISRERAAEAVAAASWALAQGRGARAGAERLGISENALQGRLRAAKTFYGLEPERDPPPPVIEIVSETAKQRIRVKAPSSRDDSPVYRILGIGDAHDSPELDKARFGWLGKYAADLKPDAAVFIGDIADFEGRIWKYEEASAASAGMLTQPFLDVMGRFDMRWHPEGEWLMIGGVGFVHAPTGLTGRLMGGEWMNAIANRSRVSTVMGHSHRAQVVTAHKIGPFGNITLVNLGTALPYGYIKPYAKIATSGWSWGACLLTIQGGHIIGHDFISMQELASRYGP